MADLKIEITKLYGLHVASLELEHGVRGSGQSSLSWRPFAPSRFIYAFFTFNSIYSIDWNKSFSSPPGKVEKWDLIVNPKDRKTRRMYEWEQFYGLVSFYRKQIGVDAHPLFLETLNNSLRLFDVSKPEQNLLNIDVTNEDYHTKPHRRKFKANFEKLRQNELCLDEFHDSLCSVLSFIYAVRCNIFHGTKSKVEMEDEEQQCRLLIYTAILIATNKLLFEAAQTGGSWKEPKVNLETGYASTTHKQSGNREAGRGMV